MCGLAGMDHSEADAHGVFLALDARSSGHLGIEDALYGEPELQWSPSGKTVAQVPPPKGTLREQYAARVKVCPCMCVHGHIRLHQVIVPWTRFIFF